jgi:hypothetical protein
MLNAVGDVRIAFHDVRNLLLAIESQAVAALARLETTHPTRPAVGAIQSSARRAMAALEKVRLGDEAAMPTSSDVPAATDISALLEGIAPVVEQQMGDIVRLSLRLPTAPAIVDGAPGDIEQAPSELVRVLGSAMYHPGLLRVAGRVVAVPGEPSSAHRRVIEIELQADGRTLTDTETASARRTIESKGGRVLIEDAAGASSTVRILLPARTS